MKAPLLSVKHNATVEKSCLLPVACSKADLARLEAQVSTDRYQLVTAQTTLQNYKLQLKQLLELDGEEEMNLYLPALDNSKVLSPPTYQNGCLSCSSCRTSGN